MTLPLWFRVVKDYPKLTKGPTLPFLIGALRPDPDAAHVPRDWADLHTLRGPVVPSSLAGGTVTG